MPHGFDNTLGIVKDLDLVPLVFLLFSLFICLSILMSSASPASFHPCIIDKQEAFIHRVLEIPFDKQECRDLITLYTLHAYYGGPKPTPATCCLNSYSRRRKFLLPSSRRFPSVFYLTFVICPLQKWKQPKRALVRASIAVRK